MVWPPEREGHVTRFANLRAGWMLVSWRGPEDGENLLARVWRFKGS